MNLSCRLNKQVRYVLGASVLAMALAACSSSPTGRNQVLLYDAQQMNGLGAQSFAEIKKNETILEDPAVNAYVQCITNAITKEIPPSFGEGVWEVVVFDSEQVNAFALPGGHIGVYTGLMNVATNQSQLGTVIGHEISHVLARHSNERLSREQIAGIGATAAAIAIGVSDMDNKGAAMAALGLGVQFGVLLPYGRAQESEADMIGLELMARAGFDPQESVNLWRNMAKESGGGPPELLSTHPSHDTRISDLQRAMPQAEQLKLAARAQSKNPKCTTPKIPKPKAKSKSKA
ncbi:M48 family peptidase [Alginatibacterium sediminis]|uniref:M48 family peptidase n=1 Tax=Alginatibacterium sediminis TaxID=2164068 RepID=A0A420E857_9ALTE|nr:M48 family metallopeptidase [Alginatibacterium sediminis]RKF15601.1 M48 family peptidase [Alginatibacterium sediminis]